MAAQVPQLLFNELERTSLLTPEVAADLANQMQTDEKDFGALLVEHGVISDDDLLKMKAAIYQLPIVKAEDIDMDPELSKEVSDSTVQLYGILPFSRTSEALKVAMVNPENIDALQALKFIASDQNLALEKYLVSYKDFGALSRNFLSLTSEVGKALESVESENPKEELRISEKETDLNSLTAEAPVSKVVAAIIKHAVDTRTSDIHIEPLENAIRLRFRIDGALQTALTLPLSLLSALVTRIKILAELKIDEMRLAQDGRFSTKIADKTVDFRVSTLPTRNGEKVELRILDPSIGNIELSDLGLEGRSLQLIVENLAKPFGSILITGPTGSGKSTTLAACLRKISTEEVNIVTLEDPIEYYIPGVNQSQIHEEIGYTFASGLRHILRQDPDVIMVGEIRDHETAGLATQAALTGHVVLSTIHTNDTIGVIPRLLDMGVEKYLIAPSLNLAVAQRLLRRVCADCRQVSPATPSEEKMITDALAKMPKSSVESLPQRPYQLARAGAGCKSCGNKAYTGRVAIVEALAMTDELERIILTDLSEEKLRAESRRQEMITMYEDGIIKVLRGMTTIEELMRVANV